MNYPVEILPNPVYCLINCDLREFHLIRHTNTSDINELWDDNSGCIKATQISAHSLHLIDLSTSLLPLFKGEYTKIELTDSGKSAYGCYCAPNATVELPTLGHDYIVNENRNYWCLPIEKIDGKIVEYKKGEEIFRAQCKVIHTPMKWNVWHFSIRWDTHEGFIHDEPAVLKRNWVRALAHNAIVLIKENAILAEPIKKDIESRFYTT